MVHLSNKRNIRSSIELLDPDEGSDSDAAHEPTITWREDGSIEKDTVGNSETVGFGETDDPLNIDTGLCPPQEPQSLKDPRDRFVLELQQQLEKVRRQAENGCTTLGASYRKLKQNCDKKDSEILKLKSTVEDEKAKLCHQKEVHESKLERQETKFQSKLLVANEKNGITLAESKITIWKDAKKVKRRKSQGLQGSCLPQQISTSQLAMSWRSMYKLPEV
jgi:hypothetical protein